MADNPVTPQASGANGAGVARPSVLSLPIKEKAALYAAYMPFLQNGGIFVPTNKPYKLGDDIYLILTLLDDPTKYPIAGKVAWVTPAGANNNKAQGIGVHFSPDESGQRVKQRIEELLGAALRSSRATHTL
ncbi:PilZ domain-containing protein [Noviherbaspirillum saxi]|uniref:Pilus assembly protein PilZ n=1 Tax=Noviherbaspirillum saxi TaxID=2320863 RepID=A0A3A3FQU4_9BURK|nr:PilZ domain-containing protein [Noviherbaspirillum saxi]RJF95832.1 pilus assembly protein PilZ [Noviherbaspirillum saxi]